MTKLSGVSAIFGGTFDPPHLSHLAAVRGLFANPGVKRVFVIPAAKPPHKPAHVESAHRLRMTELLFEGVSDVLVDRREIDREKTGQPSYSIDTILDLKKTEPNLAFVIGADQLRDFPKWHRFADCLSACHWIVLTRRPDGEAKAQAAAKELESRGLARPTDPRSWALAGGKTLEIVETPAPALSSTEIRRQIALKGLPPEGALSDLVTRYLKDHGLYGTPRE